MASEAQRDWTKRLDAVIAEGLPLLGMEDNAQLGDWVLVLSAPHLDEDGELTSGYSITFSGNLLYHNALGLLEKGGELLDTGEEHTDE